METNFSQNFNPGNSTQNSSIGERQRKLYLKVHSLMASAENFEALKLYEE